MCMDNIMCVCSKEGVYINHLGFFDLAHLKKECSAFFYKEMNIHYLQHPAKEVHTVQI